MCAWTRVSWIGAISGITPPRYVNEAGPKAGLSSSRGKRRSGHADRAEQAVRLVVGTGREVQDVGRPGAAAVAEANAPETVDHDRAMAGRLQMTGRLPA